MNTNFTRELMFGMRPVRRTDPKPGQSEWYYLDPRGTDRFEDMKEIDVPSENSPNPYANEIQNYLYNNDSYNYKELYGNTPPPALNQPTLTPIDNTNSYTTESTWGYPNNTQSPYYQQMGEPYNTKTEPEYQIGTLSAAMESNGGKQLWNNGNLDKAGGWSYGTYQIATKNGTMNDYLTHLQKNPNYQGYYNTLQQAGGYNAALIGDGQFKNAWADLSNDKNFLQSQQDFIIDKKLNPAIRYVNDIKGLDFDKRSPVVKDVMFSTATQHGEGGARDIFHNALGYDASNLTDEDIINRIYQERGNVGKYFRNSTQNYQNNLKNNRFGPENARALELLKRYP